MCGGGGRKTQKGEKRERAYNENTCSRHKSIERSCTPTTLACTSGDGQRGPELSPSKSAVRVIVETKTSCSKRLRQNVTQAVTQCRGWGRWWWAATALRRHPPPTLHQAGSLSSKDDVRMPQLFMTPLLEIL